MTRSWSLGRREAQGLREPGSTGQGLPMTNEEPRRTPRSSPGEYSARRAPRSVPPSEDIGGFHHKLEVTMAEIKLAERDRTPVAQGDGDPGLVPEGGIIGRFPDDLPRRAGIPELTLDALVRYVEHGIRTGSFTRAVLEGDLFEALRRADDCNQRALPDIVKWLYWVPPGGCYGSPQKVKAWIAMNRLERTRLVNDCPTWEDFMAARGVTS